MAVTPNNIITPQTPNAATVRHATANTTFTANPTTPTLLMTAGANGARVTRLVAIPNETIADTQLQVFRSTDAGTTIILFDSAKALAYTYATGTEATTTDFAYTDLNPIIMKANERLYVANGIAKSISYTAEWQDY